MQQAINVYILCGLIGSGKSTWAKETAKKTGAIIINRDSIRTMIFGCYSYDRQKEDFVCNIAESILMRASDCGYDVIIDETNLTVKKRKRWINLAKDIHAWQIELIWFTEEKNNLSNRMNDARGIDEATWSKVLEDMKKTFEVPIIEEGFDSIKKVEI